MRKKSQRNKSVWPTDPNLRPEDALAIAKIKDELSHYVEIGIVKAFMIELSKKDHNYGVKDLSAAPGEVFESKAGQEE